MAQRSDLRRFDAAQGPRILGPQDGRLADLGSIGARFMALIEETGGGFSLVEHPMPPRRLTAPIRGAHRPVSAACVQLSPSHEPQPMPGPRVGQDFRKASRSTLIVSAWVVGMPCGNPLYVFSVPF
jgi:hypothetical protein